MNAGGTLRRLAWIAAACAFLPAACFLRSPAPPPSAPLRFETRRFERLLPGCGDKQKREEPCVSFHIEWPEATGGPAPAALPQINTVILSSLQPENAPRSFEAEATSLIQNYQKFKNEFPSSAITYFVRRTAAVIHNTSSVLSIQVDEHSFLGGAHPNSRRAYLNLRPDTGAPIMLDSILKPAALRDLAAIAERRFREDKKLASGAKLSEGGFTFDNDAFSLPKTFGISAPGLVFYYNDYEIAPHYYGTTTLLLSWSDVRALIRDTAGVPP